MDKEDVIEYEGKRVKVNLLNGYFYKGKILSAGEDYIKISQEKKSPVLIVLSQIVTIEVQE